MTKLTNLSDKLRSKLAEVSNTVIVAFDEITIECNSDVVLTLMQRLRDEPVFAFDQLIDVCAVDYLLYGKYDWETDAASENGFSRGVEAQEEHAFVNEKPRFAVVYHLLSTQHNYRVRVKVYLEENNLMIPSVHEIWPVANWFEREAYDLYGILFSDHPDLRRILTDYGFVGHPFRKDFPVSGYVEMRYDANLQKVIYEPVDIEPRVLVPKVIRHDNRYEGHEGTDA
jgi:NADH-quinone oxidoreductase subunit C